MPLDAPVTRAVFLLVFIPEEYVQQELNMNRFRFGAILALTVAATGLAQTKQPITHEALWMMKRVGAPAVSPDGKWVVVSVTEPAYEEKDQVSDLWIVPSDGSAKPRRLTFTKGGESGAAWSPDSQRLAFSAKREGDDVGQTYVLDVAEGGEAVRPTSLSTDAPSPRV